VNPYDRDYDPPAAVIEVGLAAAGSRRRRQMTARALLDTGSEITAIPRRYAESLRLYPISRLTIEDLALKRTTVLSYAVQLSVGGQAIPRLEVVLTALDYVVLGRDVLNRFYLALNGPELTFEVRSEPTLDTGIDD
jgi:predicted aspartyl protease